MSEISWRHIALGLIATGAVGAIGYTVYKHSFNTTATTQTKKTKEKEKKKTKKTKKREATSNIKEASSSKLKQEANTATAVNPNDLADAPPKMKEMMNECDKPLSELLSFPPEQKQKIFYALLMQGEVLLGKGADGVAMAVSYFSKAVALVPNPGEVIAALEKTLPQPIFAQLLDKLQVDIQLKVNQYFTSLLPQNEFVAFKETKIFEASVERSISKWVPVAATKISAGTVLWEETCDISNLAVHLIDSAEVCCEFCFADLEDSEEFVSCPKCKGSQRYCNEKCLQASNEIYHRFFCGASDQVKRAYKELVKLCKDTNSSLALFIHRYVSLLLSEELRGNGSANGGPFAHYDHLKPVFKAAKSADKKEAHLLRTIFSGSNENITEFLTDEIYASMKNTLAQNIYAVPKNSSADGEFSERPVLGRMEVRQSEPTHSFLSYYHTIAHIQHDCDPNVSLLFSDNAVRVISNRNIDANDSITCSYLPFDSTPSSERAIHLMRLFDLDCKCDLCLGTIDSPSRSSPIAALD